MFFRLFRHKDQSITFLGLSMRINIRLRPSFHLFEVDVWEVWLRLTRVKNEVVAIVFSLWLDDRVNECLFFLFRELDVGDMWVLGLIGDCILADLGSFLLLLQVLFEPFELLLVCFVLVETHILCQDNILCDFSPHLL